MDSEAAAEDPDQRPPPPLLGFTIAVTAARRREELGAMLERRGARIVYAPTLQIVPLSDDAELHAATHRCLAARVDVTVVTTGIGFRGWMEAVDGWAIGDRLRGRLAGSTILARGPKARGAVRAAGLVEAWSPPSESSGEVLDHLLQDDVSGKRVVVQLHGEPLPDVVDTLRAAGADVLEVPVYRWVPPPDTTPVQRLLDAVVAREVDAVVFTSAPAVVSLLAIATERGVLQELLGSLRSDVVAACVGPVTAAPLEREGVPTVQPDRGRLGALVRAIESEFPPLRTQRLDLAGSSVEVRGHVALVDGRPITLTPAPLAMLRALARHPGRVLTRAELVQELPGDANDEHAVEMAVARLRSALGHARFVQTIVKRGYRLACDP